jgi:hypothetical protein
MSRALSAECRVKEIGIREKKKLTADGRQRKKVNRRYGEMVKKRIKTQESRLKKKMIADRCKKPKNKEQRKKNR